nr:tRNA (N(6)-L-threonylcarbamoyladenosine(37)-C(2))-methylthiotransferase MtaB [uncultured Carboxylicivirga sp.]
MFQLAKKRVGFKTLGCRLNQFETDAMASKFVAMGYDVVEDSKDTDVFVVNTCTVTNQSDQKSRYAVNHALKNGHSGMLIITGCMANHHKEALETQYPNAYVVDNENKSAIPQLVQAHFNKEIVPANTAQGGVFNYAPASETFHTRSMIKIQDGCDNFCTFCIIPKVRGRATSRSVEAILENIREVVGFGYKEVVITGVNISRYEHEGVKFSGLLAKILELPLDFRVRISSIEPDSFDEEFFALLKHPKMTPHLHLCLQSASESILLQMRRMYTYRSYKEIIERLRDINPQFNITTDIIVGFPGETEDDFKASLDAVDQIGFGHVHTFKYSKRDNTRAARMTDVVPEKVKSERSQQLRKKAAEAKRSYRQQFIGSEQTVLVEKIDKRGFAHGYGEYYVPVQFKADEVKKNGLYKVKLIGLTDSKEEPVLMGQLSD